MYLYKFIYWLIDLLLPGCVQEGVSLKGGGNNDFYYACELHVYYNKTKKKKKKKAESLRGQLSLSLLTHSLFPLPQPQSLGCCIPQSTHDTIAWSQTKHIIPQQQSHSLKPPDFRGVKRKSWGHRGRAMERWERGVCERSDREKKQHPVRPWGLKELRRRTRVNKEGLGQEKEVKSCYGCKQLWGRRRKD